MAVRLISGYTVFTELPSYTVKIVMLSAVGVGVTGLAGGLTIRRSKPGEASTLITPTVTECDSVNFPGLYEIKFSSTDVNKAGITAIKFSGAGADDLYLSLTILSRSSTVLA